MEAITLVNDPSTLIETGDLLFARYRVLRVLGQGSSGTVYLCRDEMLGSTQIALKLFRPLGSEMDDLNLSQRIAQEVLLLNRISHPNIVQFYDFLVSEDFIGFTMEYFQGVSLDQVLSTKRKIPMAEANHILKQVCRGLITLHRMKIKHRDLKPHNIIVGQDGVVKLVDLGLAKIGQTTGDTSEQSARCSSNARKLSRDDHVIGTPVYLSPEQITSNVCTEQSEIYSLGVVAYELFSGKLPYGEDSLSGIFRVKLNGKRVALQSIRKDCPTEINRIVMKAISPDPLHRQQSVAQFLEELESTLEQCDTPSRPEAKVASPLFCEGVSRNSRRFLSKLIDVFFAYIKRVLDRFLIATAMIRLMTMTIAIFMLGLSVMLYIQKSSVPKPDLEFNLHMRRGSYKNPKFFTPLKPLRGSIIQSDSTHEGAHEGGIQ